MARIAFLKSDFSPKGGLEKYARRLMLGFSARGHEVFLLTTEGCEKESSLNTVACSKPSKWSLLHLIRFDRGCEKWLSEHAVDAVFGLGRNLVSQQYYRAGNGVHAAYLDHRRRFSSFFKRLTFHINPLHWLILRQERMTYENRLLKTLFTNSELVKKELLQYYPKVNPEKISVVHNGVEWQAMEKPFQEGFEKRGQLLKEKGLRSDCYQFLFVGHEYKRKGLELLLQALSLLPSKEFELSVVGKDRHIDHFKKIARSLGIEKQVHFFGPQKEVTSFYQIADTMVIPSYYDPFANVTVEALAMGLFVVTSMMNGGREVITSADQGIIFRDFRAETLARCLEMALQHPKTKSSALSIRKSVEYLDFSNQMNKIIDQVEKTI